MKNNNFNNKVFFKLSGELLTKPGKKGFDEDVADQLVVQLVKIVKELHKKIGLVVGGGNIFRGRDKYGKLQNIHTDYSADYMGVFGTFLNAIGLADLLKNKYGIQTKVFSTPIFPPITEEFNPNDRDIYLQTYDVIIFAGGLGQPGFTTDTSAVLKARNLGCTTIHKGTKVDGVYDKDPNVHEGALRFDKISYDEALKNNINVMDMAGFGLAKENNMDIVIFNAMVKDNIFNIIKNIKQVNNSIITGK